MNYEWIRYITLGLALIALLQWGIFCHRHHEPAAFAPITWLINVIGYTILKIIVNGDINFYNVSVIWANVIYLQGIFLLIAAIFIFRDYRKWTYKL